MVLSVDVIFNDEPWDISMNTILTPRALSDVHNVSSILYPRDSLLFNEITGTNATSFYGLPEIVKRLISKYKGIDELYDWQKDCLELDAVLQRKNLIYSLPTSGGKTLVAEILMLKEVLVTRKNVIFILPYVALAQEKVRSLSPFALDLGFYVEEYVGGRGKYPPVKHRRKNSIYVCTIEKASGLIESLIKTDRLIDEIGMLVVDELHLIGEMSRGAILESILSKVLFINANIQIVSMSATIGNIKEIGSFMNAFVYEKYFRPVELTEYVIRENKVFKIERNERSKFAFQLERELSDERSDELRKIDPCFIGSLVNEVIPHDSCLVFCATKKSCANVSLMICRSVDKSFKDIKRAEKISLLKALQEEGQSTVCPLLNKTIPYGVAYHHSGLTNAERKLLEEAFLGGIICCICCTSTLAAGVNLPAKRVIICSPYVGNNFMKLSTYKQMCGRAGRMGFTEIGQSFLLCQESDIPKIKELLTSSMDSCNSTLDSLGFSRLIISAIGLQLAATRAKLDELLGCTLLSRQQGDSARLMLDSCLSELTQSDAIRWNAINAEYSLTPLSEAAMSGNLDLHEAKMLLEDLREAVKGGLILDSYLHLFYLVIPYSVIDEIKIDRQTTITIYSELPENAKRVAERLGINEACLYQYVRQGKVKSIPERIWHRFLLSLIVFELWSNQSIWTVSRKFNVVRGSIQSLLTRVSAFASSVQRFCDALKSPDLECFPALLVKVTPRLMYCCAVELLQLVQLPSVKMGRAQQLFKAGFKTINDVAKAEPQKLVSLIDHLPRKVAYEMVAAAKLMILENIEILRDEAEILQEELNVAIVCEENNTSVCSSNANHSFYKKRLSIGGTPPVSQKRLRF